MENQRKPSKKERTKKALVRALCIVLASLMVGGSALVVLDVLFNIL